jgi:hypothetical protein
MAVPEEATLNRERSTNAMKELQVISTDELEEEAILELPAREAMTLISASVCVSVNVNLGCHPCDPCSRPACGK